MVTRHVPSTVTHICNCNSYVLLFTRQVCTRKYLLFENGWRSATTRFGERKFRSLTLDERSVLELDP